MKRVMLLISLFCISLTACGTTPTDYKDINESKIVTTNKESEKLKHGQNPEDFEGTNLEIFGLYNGDNYVNLSVCTTEDLVWFLQQAHVNGIEVGSLSKSLDPYYDELEHFEGIKIEDYGNIVSYNFSNESKLVKDCKIRCFLINSLKYEEFNNIYLLGMPINQLDISVVKKELEKYDFESNSGSSFKAEIKLDLGQTGILMIGNYYVQIELPQIIE